MKYYYLLILISIFSCNNERSLQLPEIENAEITEVLNVSPAYIFYDETQPDSTLFNRKNLIGTTNWLVNVDKRLTLRQAIPHIQYLQNKRKKASMHKNEAAKNYFTCNDTSIKNLGFLEFTDVNFITNETPFSLYSKKSQLYDDRIFIHPKIKREQTEVEEILTIEISGLFDDKFSFEKIIYFELAQKLNSLQELDSKKLLVMTLDFDKNLSFQDYVTIKSELHKIKSDKIIIDTNEFIY